MSLPAHHVVTYAIAQVVGHGDCAVCYIFHIWYAVREINITSASDISRSGWRMGMWVGCGCMNATSGIGKHLAGVHILHISLSRSLPKIQFK